jgi:hypothetical protein
MGGDLHVDEDKLGRIEQIEFAVSKGDWRVVLRYARQSPRHRGRPAGEVTKELNALRRSWNEMSWGVGDVVTALLKWMGF